MASGFLMLLDDIATVLDDVAIMTKAAAKKTAGVVGDDLALNANQITNINANRELPVIFKIFKGAIINKLILVPLALLISYVAPWLITPLLMIGGAYLCFEGTEKIIHYVFHKKEVEKHKKEVIEAISNKDVDMLSFEKEKIKSAIKTDFILSAEIIAISLGVVASKPIMIQTGVLFIVGLVMTVFIYGFVAGLVRLDDLGFYLKTKSNSLLNYIGDKLIQLTPKIMKVLSVLGTAAMFLVGGEIISHGIPVLDELLKGLNVPLLPNILFGLIVGGVVVGLIQLFNKLKN